MIPGSDVGEEMKESERPKHKWTPHARTHTHTQSLTPPPSLPPFSSTRSEPQHATYPLLPLAPERVVVPVVRAVIADERVPEELLRAGPRRRIFIQARVQERHKVWREPGTLPNALVCFRGARIVAAPPTAATAIATNTTIANATIITATATATAHIIHALL